MLDLDDLEAKAKAAGPAWVKDGPWAETCVQPAEVLALIRELREARAVIAKALEWHDRATPIRDVLRDALHTTGEPNA